MAATPRAARRIRRAALAAVAAGGLAAGASATAPAAPVTAYLPTDPLYPEQLALQPGATLGAPEAWTVSRGAGVVVAVLDTGVDTGHPDLRGALWRNPDEIAGNGRDDDGNGYADDVHGVDLVNRDGDPADDEGHGTHVAGIVAARADGQGAIGLAPESRLMVVKVLDARRGGSTDVVAEGIRYALAEGAHVINLSVNGPEESDELRAAARAAGAAGVTIVTSAGNGAADLGLVPSFPVSYDEPAVLGVTAAQPNGLLAFFANFGRRVALAAPGVDVLSTGRGGGYELRSGTSMASPEAAGALALLHAARPDLPDATLREALTQGARRVPGLAGRVTAGALDVAAALRRVVPASAWPAPAPVLKPRVRRRSRTGARRPRSLITWTVTGDASRIRSFRLTAAGGRVLARRGGAGARGAWVSTRRGRVTVAALGPDGVRVTRASITLR